MSVRSPKELEGMDNLYKRLNEIKQKRGLEDALSWFFTFFLFFYDLKNIEDAIKAANEEWID